MAWDTVLMSLLDKNVVLILVSTMEICLAMPVLIKPDWFSTKMIFENAEYHWEEGLWQRCIHQEDIDDPETVCYQLDDLYTDGQCGWCYENDNLMSIIRAARAGSVLFCIFSAALLLSTLVHASGVDQPYMRLFNFTLCVLQVTFGLLASAAYMSTFSHMWADSFTDPDPLLSSAGDSANITPLSDFTLFHSPQEFSGTASLQNISGILNTASNGSYHGDDFSATASQQQMLLLGMAHNGAENEGKYSALWCLCSGLESDTPKFGSCLMMLLVATGFAFLDLIIYPFYRGPKLHLRRDSDNLEMLLFP